jgi:DNA topoisomerase IB
VAEVRLVHVHGGEPGLRRERRGRGFAYLDREDNRVDDRETLDRIRSLRIPPAWTQVWIAAEAHAHLQATGLDSKGRRQYLYHPEWRQRRDQEKFDDMLAFATALPALRRTAVERVLALAIRLLDVGLFRVGWDRYARDNGHVGLTTLQREHLRLRDATAVFDYVAKAGKRRRQIVRDPLSVRLLGPLKRRRSGPAELLAFRTPRGAWHRVHAPDVNNALRAWTGGPYSAKEFRTWEATVLAAVALAREDALGHGGPRAVGRAVREVSQALGNTPKVARDSYIDPRVIDSYERGAVIELPPELGYSKLVDTDDGGVVITLPTTQAGDAVREQVEGRVLALLSAARPSRAAR